MSEPVQVDRWIHCDRFFWGPKEEWPKEPEGLRQLPDGIFDLNSQTTSSFTHSLERQASGEIVNSIFARVSSWRKLTRVVAWWVRKQAHCHQIKGDTAKKLTFDQPLNTVDIEKAENAIVAFNKMFILMNTRFC
jgi:hypothetical protein